MAPFSHTLPVRFADVDHVSLVYYPLFFDYFHAAFEEFFRKRIGARAYVALHERRRIGFPAVRAECDFRAPLRFGDMVRVEMSVERIGEKSIRFRYLLHRTDEEGGEGVVSAEGRVVCVVTDLDRLEAVPIPADMRQLFLELLVENE